jgi:hypothetical protein
MGLSDSDLNVGASPASSTAVDQEARVAFAVLAHKNPDQVAKLISALDLGSHCCVVHCDLKATGLSEEIERRLPPSIKAHVRFMDSRSVTWGGWGLIGATLGAMRTMLEWRKDWTHFVNLSGQCLPIRPVRDLARFLEAHPGCNFVEWVDARADFRRALRWSRFHHLEIAGRVVFTPIPRRLASRHIYKGSNWVILSRHFCEFVQDDPVMQAQIEAFRHAKLPEEMVFQTLLMNGPFRDTVVNDNKRLVIWPYRYAPHPVVLTVGHLGELDTLGPFFARKFDIELDSQVVEMLVHRAQSPGPAIMDTGRATGH